MPTTHIFYYLIHFSGLFPIDFLNLRMEKKAILLIHSNPKLRNSISNDLRRKKKNISLSEILCRHGFPTFLQIPKKKKKKNSNMKNTIQFSFTVFSVFHPTHVILSRYCSFQLIEMKKKEINSHTNGSTYMCFAFLRVIDHLVCLCVQAINIS